MMLQPLGDRSILQAVIQNVLDLVSPDDKSTWSSATGKTISRAPGARLSLRGAGAAAGHRPRRAASGAASGRFRRQPADPLWRHAAVPPGLDSRPAQPSRLKQAHLTLLTAVLDHPLPYGRIIRNAAGQIMDIIEDTEASPEVREIRELNVGAYAVDAAVIFPALRGCRPRPRRRLPPHRLRPRTHSLGPARGELPALRSGRSAGHQLRRRSGARRVHLEKRLFRPRRQEEQNLVTFGTGGWRAIIGEGFTMHNVRRLSQALANEITRRRPGKAGVIIGYDRRFLSRQAAEASAEVFAGNNIPPCCSTRMRPRR